jgi:hypothetical protein
MPLAEHVPVIVRHHGLGELTRVNLLAANDERNVDPLVGHRTQTILERSSFRRSGRVTLDRLVHGRRYATVAVESDHRARDDFRGCIPVFGLVAG